MSADDDDRRGMSDAYWRARESADAKRENTGAMGQPEVPVSSPEPNRPYGPVDPPPPTPADVAPTPEGPPDFAPYSPSMQTSAPAPADMKAQRLAALQEASRLASSPVDTGIGDKDIAAAQGRDREQRGKDAFTEAIQAWLQRRPQRLQNPTEGNDVIQRRQLAESSALKQRGQQLSVQEQIAKALTEPKAGATPGALSEYQKYEMDRNARTDAEKKTTAEKKATDAKAQLERDRAMLQKDFPNYDLSQADEKTISNLLSLRHAKANERMAEATFGENKAQHIDQQAHELTKELGDPAVFDAQYARVQQLIEQNGGQVPGTGKWESAKQDSVLAPLLSGFSSPEAVEGRKLVKQLGNNYVHAITGAGVSNAERAQLQSASVDVDSSDDRQIILGLKTLKDMYDSKVRNAKAGYRPEAVERIEKAQPPSPEPIKPTVRVRDRTSGKVKKLAPDVAEKVLRNPNYERVDG